MHRRQILLEVIVSLYVLLFLYASLSKFLDFRTFVKELNNQPLPNSWTPFLVWAIPCSEITLSLALIFERTRMIGLYGSLVLMGLFSGYTLLVLSHAFSYIPCSCGGIIKRLTWRQHLVLNLFFMALAIAGIILQRGKAKHPVITK
ncbi:MAG TPA: MauE/DoxX family redox-associated membrane protein [Puia sp.]|nr:MauE/DoxX family redox-associated membrane protein [Puia sp.]